MLISCSPTNTWGRVTLGNEEAVTNSDNSLPVVCWHGINDNARSCDMIFAALNSSTETLSIQVGDSLEADKYNSIFMGMLDQVTQSGEHFIIMTMAFFNIIIILQQCSLSLL